MNSYASFLERHNIIYILLFTGLVIFKMNALNHRGLSCICIVYEHLSLKFLMFLGKVCNMSGHKRLNGVFDIKAIRQTQVLRWCLHGNKIKKMRMRLYKISLS